MQPTVAAEGPVTGATGAKAGGARGQRVAALDLQTRFHLPVLGWFGQLGRNGGGGRWGATGLVVGLALVVGFALLGSVALLSHQGLGLGARDCRVSPALFVVVLVDVEHCIGRHTLALDILKVVLNWTPCQ